MSTLIDLLSYGQSYWLDNLTRKKITGGELKKRVTEQGLRGITSNPSIFNKAIAGSDDYDSQIKELVDAGKSPQEIYDALTIKDVQDACDILMPVYEQSGGTDGFVSLEVSPFLARDTEGSCREARRLFKGVNRPNSFIKIPGTKEGVPAIETLLYEGININVTLLFSIQRFEEVANAYIRAMQRRANENKPIDKIISVASFFLSRIDVLTDQLLGHYIIPSGNKDAAGPASLAGKTGNLQVQSWHTSVTKKYLPAVNGKSCKLKELTYKSRYGRAPVIKIPCMRIFATWKRLSETIQLTHCLMKLLQRLLTTASCKRIL